MDPTLAPQPNAPLAAFMQQLTGNSQPSQSSQAPQTAPSTAPQAPAPLFNPQTTQTPAPQLIPNPSQQHAFATAAQIIQSGQLPAEVDAPTLALLMHSGQLAKLAKPTAAPQAAVPTAPTTPQIVGNVGDLSPDKQSVANQVATAALQTFGADQVNPVLQIIKMESGFNPTAQNPTSSASGLFQFLDSTAKNYGISGSAKDAPLGQQIQAGLNYIKARYGTPAAALQFHVANGWY